MQVSGGMTDATGRGEMTDVTGLEETPVQGEMTDVTGLRETPVQSEMTCHRPGGNTSTG